MSYESPSILSQEHLGATRKDPESEWLARDNPETNSITLKGKTASHTAEQFSWVPLPCGFPPRQPFPVKPLALSACMSPRTIHSQVLDKSPLSGAGRGPPACTILHGYWCHGRKNGRWCDECWQGHLGRVGGKGVSERWWLSWDGDDEKPPDSKEESEAPRWEQAWQTQGPGEGTVAGAQFILALGGPSVWRERRSRSTAWAHVTQRLVKEQMRQLQRRPGPHSSLCPQALQWGLMAPLLHAPLLKSRKAHDWFLCSNSSRRDRVPTPRHFSRVPARLCS